MGSITTEMQEHGTALPASGAAGETVSVVLCTYNYAEYLSKALGSVVSQTYPHWECIIVDDASTDDTRQVVSASAAADRRIRYFRNEHNLGVGASRNIGTALATGDWVAVLDADDWWHHEKLQRQVEALTAAPAAVLCHTAHMKVSPETIAVETCPEAWRSDLEYSLRAENLILHSSVLVARRALRAVGGYDERLLSAHDWDLYLKLLSRFGGRAFVYLDTPLSYYRVHGQGITSNWRRMRSDERHIIRRHVFGRGWALIHPRSTFRAIDEQIHREVGYHAANRDARGVFVLACARLGISPFTRWRWRLAARSLFRWLVVGG